MNLDEELGVWEKGEHVTLFGQLIRYLRRIAVAQYYDGCRHEKRNRRA